MKMIFKIFLRDLRNIRINIVALVVVMGLAILPSLYAWFNILSNWDPYGPESTGNLTVAVAYDDIGLQLGETKINISENIIEGLKSNNSIGWVFTDSSEEAINGVWAGDYYAALIMPEDFTKDMISFLSDSITHPEIVYYTNQKKNAIAPKITDKAKTAVQAQINESFVSTLTKALVNTAATSNYAGDLNALSGEGEYGQGATLLDLLIGKLQVARAQISALQSSLNAIRALISTGENVSDLTNTMQAGVQATTAEKQNAINDFMSQIAASKISESEIFGQLQPKIDELNNYITELENIYNVSKADIDAFSNAVSSMGQSIDETIALVDSLCTDLDTAIDGLSRFRDSGTYALLQTALTLDSEDLANFVSSPVIIESKVLYPIDNYGSAMAPFYSVLAIWVGALILVAIVHVDVKPFKDGSKFNHVQAFFGRYLIFFVISQVQALLISFGDMFYIRIQCEHPFKYWFACAFIALVFSLIAYSLTVAFENVGEAIVVVIMVIQVAGAGGTFPIQLLPAIYQAIYKFLPFTYAMDTLRECIAGEFENYYLQCILMLTLYIIASLLIGLVLAIPCRKLNKLIAKHKKQSGIMI